MDSALPHPAHAVLADAFPAGYMAVRNGLGGIAHSRLQRAL
nr:hypothetical protein [Erwinia sp. Ejp617]